MVAVKIRQKVNTAEMNQPVKGAAEPMQFDTDEEVGLSLML